MFNYLKIILIISFPLFQVYSNTNEYTKRIKRQNFLSDSLTLEINNAEKEIKKLSTTKEKELEKLRQLENSIDLQESLIVNIDSLNQMIGIKIDEYKIVILQLETSIDVRKSLLADRLRAIQKEGRAGELKNILSIESPNELINRVKAFEYITNYDKVLLNNIKSESLTKEQKYKELIIEKKRLVESKNRYKTENENLVADREKRKNLILEINSKEDSWAKVISELKEAQNIITDIIDSLNISSRKKAVIPKHIRLKFTKNNLIMPIKNGKVITSFGKVIHPIYETVINSKGIDIKAELNSDVVSISAGFIEYIGSMHGYGKFVVINHGDGYFAIYSHLNRVSVALKTNIKKGALVGKVGESGSLNGVKLHFELRKDSKAIDPLLWIKK